MLLLEELPPRVSYPVGTDLASVQEGAEGLRIEGDWAEMKKSDTCTLQRDPGALKDKFRNMLKAYRASLRTGEGLGMRSLEEGVHFSARAREEEVEGMVGEW